MDMETLLQYEWNSMWPEFTILLTAVALSLIDLFMNKKKDRSLLIWLALAGIAVAIVCLVLQFDDGVVSILNETYRLDSFAKAFKFLMLLGTGFVLLLGVPDESTSVRGEYIYLILTALLGGMMMASSADLITLFVGLELLSLSSYVLVGIRKTNPLANEAAFKYVVNGGIATAITLFGMSYLYGLTGETNIYEIQGLMGSDVVTDNRFLAVFAFLMIVVGLAFKITAAPFHMWAPDVYQGAETPVTAFLSVVSKIAGFAIMLRLLMVPFVFAPGTGKIITPDGISYETLLVSVRPYLVLLAIVTILVGNVIALRQLNAKRLFAYSSIAHAGYLLVPLAALSELVFEAVWFYLTAYLLMNIGAFAVIHVMSAEEEVTVASFAGLFKRAPYLTIAMSIYLLSLAGIPLTAGFIGKFEIFMSALGTEPKRYLLVTAMLVGTVLSYVYYFGLFVQMYFRPSKRQKPVTISNGVTAVLAITVAGTVLLGIFPSIALTFIHDHFQFLEIFNP
ncbi:NADH-quinone oxidoreductase subunit NuoN [Alkalihalobacillus macyae]|uniref:NADH-quinone oxidoreductase subunit NuoN n=1 Tax=Guptibacillus hwajinpoensis TaxID=208199 RepID=UPI00273C3FA3|nr:NADH-quinone oxidoreductase subunit NuoN [Alkalihalobacillus macyae]MDP4551575.1 NADH-quinone oxidoreductase subunit NuoN [Alkalihalobacillus macyae]